MHFHIDLNALAIRESAKVEWKENGDDKNIVQSIILPNSKNIEN